MSSPINKELLEHLASLSRIELTKDEEETLLHDLQAILAHSEDLKKVDTSSVVPLSGGTTLTNRMREDGDPNIIPAEGLISSFPESHNNYLKVPPVFGE